MILPFEFAPKAKRATCVSAYDFFVDRGRGDLAILESYTTFGWFPVCRAMCASMRSPRDLRCEISDVPARIKVEGVSALIFEQMQGISIETPTESSFRVKIRRPPRRGFAGRLLVSGLRAIADGGQGPGYADGFAG